MFFFGHLVSGKHQTKPESHKLFPDAALKSQLENIFVKNPKLFLCNIFSNLGSNK